MEFGLRVGVLSPHNSKETKAILNAVRALGHEPVWIRDENVASWIEDGSVRISPSVDVLVNRLLLTKSAQPLEDLQLAALYEEIAPVLNRPTAVQNALHKYRAGALLAAADLPVPDAYFGRSPRTFEEWRTHLPSTAAHKRTIGTNGGLMSVVSPEETVNPRIKNTQAFVQEFLEGERERPYDVRVYVVGGEVIGAMRRHAPDDDWRTNVALGGAVEDVTDDLGPAPRRLATEATRVLGLDISGVDLMPVGDEWYILEVNPTAGFRGLFEATGISAAPHIARLAIDRGGGQVTSSQVDRLASTLDDSVPDCKPPMSEPDDGNDVIGYTTRIRLSGNAGATSAVAKADTGAKRTSVDTELAGEIGAGPLVGTTQVRTGSTNHVDERPLVEVDVSVNGCWRTVTASITDRSDLSYSVLLGRDVLDGYKVDISERVEE
ncbi:MAG: ATP-grasp domain-containing protein [Halobacteriales archaeon]